MWLGGPVVLFNGSVCGTDASGTVGVVVGMVTPLVAPVLVPFLGLNVGGPPGVFFAECSKI